jgi:hypothetical protein
MDAIAYKIQQLMYVPAAQVDDKLRDDLRVCMYRLADLVHFNEDCECKH